jgi:hypothetical protein
MKAAKQTAAEKHKERERERKNKNNRDKKPDLLANGSVVSNMRSAT